MSKWKVAILCLIISITQCAKFGDDNSYTCHCINDEQCDKETGLCSGDCAKGWSGASCQKQNVALGKPTSQVDTGDNRTSDLAVDGDRTTNISNKCSDTSSGNSTRWWRVDLEEEYPINNITIYYRSTPSWARTSLNGFSLHVNQENQEPELCYKDETEDREGLPAVNDITCNQLTGRYVKISNSNTRSDSRYLLICEVEIYVCSVGTFGSDCINFCHCLNNKRCSETGQCPSRCADGWKGTSCSQKCIDGFYGEGCQTNCGKCLNNSACDHVDGECTGECSDGYLLTNCSKACDNDTYGAGCIKLCSDRNCLVETSLCNHINGSCQGGCKDGFSGIDCLRCEDGVYGAGCSKKCSDRKCKDSDVQCDSKTGECIDGCQPGYQSIDCTLGSSDQIGFVIGIGITTPIIGFVVGALMVLFVMKRRLKSKANKSDNVTGNQLSNNATPIEQPVTQPPSNNQDNPYGELNTIYQNEHAYELLELK